MSCDVVDMLHTDLIQPGHRTICSAKVNLEINVRETSLDVRGVHRARRTG
jgi:hypothetical protein